MKKEKGPAPPPPVVSPTKEPVEEKIIPEVSIAEDIDNQPNRQEIIEPPISTTPEKLSSQPEVCECDFGLISYSMVEFNI